MPTKKPTIKKATTKKAVAKPAPKKVAAKKPTAKKAVAKKPVAKKVPKKVAAVKKVIKPAVSKLDKVFLKSQLKKLEEERNRYLASAEQLEEEADALQAEKTTSDIQVAEESGDGDTTAQYMEMDRVMSAQAREVVEDIEAAIERIRNGSYGICVDSGKPIPKKRLEAIPWASQTVEAKAGGLRQHI